MALRNFLSIVLYCYHYYYYYYYCIIIIVITIITGPYQAQSLFNVTVSWGFGGGDSGSFFHTWRRTPRRVWGMLPRKCSDNRVSKVSWVISSRIKWFWTERKSILCWSVGHKLEAADTFSHRLYGCTVLCWCCIKCGWLGLSQQASDQPIWPPVAIWTSV